MTENEAYNKALQDLIDVIKRRLAWDVSPLYKYAISHVIEIAELLKR